MMCPLLSLAAGGVHAASRKLHSNSTLATADNYLTWSWPDAPANTSYTLVEETTAASQASGRAIYDDPDLASVISAKLR